MLGIDELKERINSQEATLECPVKDCTTRVKRISNANLKSLDSCHEKRRIDDALARFKDYFCDRHKIFITPSTFIYSDYTENLLWKDNEDIALLERVLQKKRVKGQLYHDNSEDAVTWNVLRFLEKNNLIKGLLTSITGTPQAQAEIIYWSYSQKEESGWSLINKAREEFGEEKERGSEPDIIIETDRAIFFIEAKLTSGNDTPSNEKQIEEKIRNPKKYKTGGGNWYQNVFLTSYDEILRKQKYELLRFWLLGTWMAEKTVKECYLINLVREGQKENIETAFKKHIKENERREFHRITWESIYKYILGQNPVKNKNAMIRFFKNKTIGYRNGALQKAFSIT
jgi:hypothetical protein